MLRSGIHLVIVDLFPPSVRDPQGIHRAIWDELVDNDFSLPPDKNLTLASYIGGPVPESFVEPVAVARGPSRYAAVLDPRGVHPFASSRRAMSRPGKQSRHTGAVF